MSGRDDVGLEENVCRPEVRERRSANECEGHVREGSSSDYLRRESVRESGSCLRIHLSSRRVVPLPREQEHLLSYPSHCDKSE